ncbi:MAG TPA: HAD-IA family hydrolase [Acidimicrobiia bacterium]|nr:HAD-IA family hydrolase [Acidimicrobiia bacterium]
MRYEAVVFDLGGVVFPSPLDVFRVYEREHGLPHRFISEVVLADPEHGAWGRLERGELSLEGFCDAFDAECAAHGGKVDSRDLMQAVGAGLEPRPAMVAAISAIRGRGLKTAALTNNWADDAGRREASPTEDWFDVVVESAVEGLRKPDPRIYRLVCTRLEVAPSTAVFLDDLGANLKPAREMGMTTIKVAEPDTALAELESVLGFALGG